MRGGGEHPKQRHVAPEEETTKTYGIFSPVLKLGTGPDASAVPGMNQSAATTTTVTSSRVSSSSRTASGSSSESVAYVTHSMTTSMVLSPAAAALRARQEAEARATAAAEAERARAAAIAAAEAAEAAALAAEEAEAEAAANQEYEEFNPYLFIKLLPPYQAVCPRPVNVVLPKRLRHAPPISLVLDLDETLVHCSVEPIPDPDLTFHVSFNGTNYDVYVRKRPYLDRFLQWIAGRFEVTIFTASQQVYAERLLNLLDPEGKYINYRLFRDSCLQVDGNYLKDLNVLGRDLSKAVLVDNSPHAFGYQLDNGIPIESWFDDRADTELLKLMRFLETLQGQHDVRSVVREKFKLHRLVEEAVIPPQYAAYA